MYTNTLRKFQLSHTYFACRCALLLLALPLIAFRTAAQSDKDIPVLQFGKPLERKLAGAQFHSYQLRLTSGQYVHVIVDQRGIDVLVRLFGPDGKQLIEVDSPNGTQGPEDVYSVAEVSGTYRLEVRSLEKDAPVGVYQVRIQELREATERDKSHLAAERTFKEAETAREKGTAESLERALKQYEAAVSLYHDSGDLKGEATALSYMGVVNYALGEPQKALEKGGQALSLYRAISDHDGEGTVLNNIGEVYYAIGEKQKALDHFSQALPLYRSTGNRSGEATTLGNLGAAYQSFGEVQKALDYYEQSLQILRTIGDASGEAVLLNNIGGIYNDLNELQKALDYTERALKLYQAAHDQRGEATARKNIGGIYDLLGEWQKSRENYEQALALYHAAGDRNGEGKALNNLGYVYSSLGEEQKALEYYERALPLLHAVGNREGEATTLNNIGGVYDLLGEKRKALDYFAQALPLYRAIQDRDGEALTLNNIGGAYDDMGEKEKALDYYSQAQRLYSDNNYNDRAMTLNNIGVIYNAMGERRKALDFFTQALPLYRAIGNRSREAKALINIGAVYDTLGEKQKAFDYFAEALPLTRVVQDRSAEAKALGKLMDFYESLNHPRSAIFCGKQSVDAYQKLRSNNQGLDRDVQKTYLKTVEQTYRGLAELLITQSRPAEAQQVLNAFKDQQFFDLERTQSAQLKSLTYTPRESDFVARYENVSDSFTRLSAQVTDLKRKLGTRQPTEEEAKQIKQLETQLNIASSEFPILLRLIDSELSKAIDARDQVGEVSDMTQMQSLLRQLGEETGQKTVAVYTIVGATKLHALVITTESVTSVSTPIKGDELNDKARQLWGLLQSADYDPAGLSNELYKSIFVPIESKLPPDAKTIMWSLDGNLRYIPMAALFDGRKYLVERFNHVVFTRVDEERLKRGVSNVWTGYGFASAAPHEVEVGGRVVRFGALDFVPSEMQIFRTRAYPKGIIDGDVFAEGQFTKASFFDRLKQKRPVIHISSHFKFQPGDEGKSFLLLGDGQVITLAELKGQSNLFQGAELLTLSACDTAAQRPDATGREIDAFAELAQRLGASGVIASLWAVRDSSTAQLMKGFYRNKEDRKLTKAEALRQAQLELLYGTGGVTGLVKNPPTSVIRGDNAIRRGDSADDDITVEAKYRIPFKRDESKPYAHPYYWSPFVLFGNWK